MIIANRIGTNEISGFNSDDNAVTFFTQDEEIDFPLQSKQQLARELMHVF